MRLEEVVWINAASGSCEEKDVTEEKVIDLFAIQNILWRNCLRR